LVYTLTEAGDELFPQSYGDLARHLVREIKETMGPEETGRVFRRVANRIAQEAPPPYEGQPFEERLEEVSEFLAEKGFLFHWQKTEDGYILANMNCPYRQVTREHAEVCVMDTTLIGLLLGVEPQPLSRLRAGDTSCSCLLVPPQ
jgi:predicted ArsR family transcriptional regulator